MKHATHCWFTRVQYLVLTLFLSVGLSPIAGTVMAQEPKVASLMSKDLKEFPGKELLMITVEHAPGGSALSTDTMHMRCFTYWRAPLCSR